MNLEAFFKITYGLYVVSSKFENKMSGFIANTVFQVTSEPVQLAITCSKNNFTTNLITQSKVFSISILQKDTSPEIISNFGYKSGKDFNKFDNTEYKIAQTGAPILLKDTIAWFECEVVEIFNVGTHLIFIGKIIDEEILNDLLEPLTYAYYRDVKKGKAPKNAPTYINPEKIIKDKNLNIEKYKCTVCGYIYDPETGDNTHDIEAGTSFKDLPGDWTCPICEADKSFFNLE